MGLLILGVNTVYIAFCFVTTLAMVGKGLNTCSISLSVLQCQATHHRKKQYMHTYINEHNLHINFTNVLFSILGLCKKLK